MVDVNDQGKIEVKITPGVREAAERLVEISSGGSQDGLTSKQRKKLYKKGGHSGVKELFYRAVYEANPHLDPDTIQSRKQREDIMGAVNDTLNELIKEIAQEKGIDDPHLLSTNVSLNR